MRPFLKASSILAATWLVLSVNTVAMAEPITIKPLYSGAVTDMSGKHMTVLEVSIEPGAGMPPHRHPGTVYAYVVSGSVKSKLSSDAAAIVYEAGQGWIEPPDGIHEVFENPSDSENALMTATFIHEEGEELVIPVGK